MAEFKFEPQSSRKKSKEVSSKLMTIDQALGAALLHTVHRFGWYDEQAQTQNASKSATVTEGRDRLSLQRDVATIAILDDIDSLCLKVNKALINYIFFLQCDNTFSINVTKTR